MSSTPGAPAPDRVLAFIDEYLRYVFEHLSLVRLSETACPGARYRIGSYRFWHQHLSILLADATDDAATMAHMILAAMAAEHLTAVLPELGRERVRSGLRSMAERILRP